MKTAFLSSLIAAAGLQAAHATQPAEQPYRIERVQFQSQGETLVGQLYIPQGVSSARPGRAAVVTGAWLTIKEQMPAVYAAELARRGTMALAFDFRGFGESGGQPRALEHPQRKTDDIRAAVAFLQTRADVDRQRIAGLALCASAGYLAEAAATTPALRSIALVAPWLHNRAIVEQVYGGEQGVIQLLAAGRAAAAAARPSLIPAASSSDRSALMFQVPYYTEPQRGLLPQWENRFNVASWEPWLSLDAVAIAPRVQVPTLIVHSEAAAIPQGARAFAAGLRAPKTERWLPGVTQFDFYDQPAAVRAAADAAQAHFDTTLAHAPLTAQGQPEEAQVRSVVASIPLAVDLAQYALAEAAFAPEIVVDYTSLWGGEPQRMTPAALMQAWRGIVPGFDATWHELSDVQARVQGERATATARVDGRHWIGEQLWRPVGRYHWELARLDGQWKVSRMVFAMEQELGDRGLAQQAMQRAAARTAAASAALPRR